MSEQYWVARFRYPGRDVGYYQPTTVPLDTPILEAEKRVTAAMLKQMPEGFKLLSIQRCRYDQEGRDW